MITPAKLPLVLAGLVLPLGLLATAMPASAKMPFCTSVKTKIGDGSAINTAQNCGDNLSRTMQVGNGTSARTEQVGRNNDAQSYHKGDGGSVVIRQRDAF